MRIYLSIPYSDKEEAKKYGARWDPKNKLWYSPDERKELLDKWPIANIERIKELVGEDRNYGGNLLFVDLIPRSCWFTNVRKCIHFSDWDRLRRYIYERANNKCECCHNEVPLDAHERWHFDDKDKVQKLVRIIALCKPCHEATHMGLAQIRGRGDAAIEHLMNVTGMNKREANEHIQEAFDLWNKRNFLKWKLDLGIITNSGLKLSQEFDENERNIISKNETKIARDIESKEIGMYSNYSRLENKNEEEKTEKLINNKNKKTTFCIMNKVKKKLFLFLNKIQSK